MSLAFSGGDIFCISNKYSLQCIINHDIITAEISFRDLQNIIMKITTNENDIKKCIYKKENAYET